MSTEDPTIALLGQTRTRVIDKKHQAPETIEGLAKMEKLYFLESIGKYVTTEITDKHIITKLDLPYIESVATGHLNDLLDKQEAYIKKLLKKLGQ